MFTPFVYLLKRLGLPLSFKYVMEFFQAVDRGLVTSLDRLFLVSRLIFVKRVEHYDLFERAFEAYFLGKTDRLEIPEVESLLNSRPFQEWLKKEMEEGNLPAEALHNIPLDELLQKFWETLLEQEEEHHGGSKWVGTGGTSPWGHSGRSRGGIRVHGQSRHGSAQKVIGQHRYINYAGEADLRAENIRQALSSLKRMIPVGPSTDLDVDATIDKTCKNGGEIELVFEKELRDRLKVMVLLDNGGHSMSPFVGRVKLLFSKMRSQFKDLDFFYFHNCIYDKVYSDHRRTDSVPLEEICRRDSQTRVFIVGDANMSPTELFFPHGAIDYEENNSVPGIDWLRLLAHTFPYAVWLNPIHKKYWPYESRTIEAIGKIFAMEELTLNGLQKAVEYLQEDSKCP